MPANPARRIGLRAEDIIVGGDGNPIDDMEALAAWKYGLSRGQAVTMTVQRGEERLELAGKIPAAELHFLFKRERPSAAARVDQRGNTVRVQGSRLGAFTILVHPDHFQLEQELVVEVDGKTVFRERVEPDPAFLLHRFLAERDRRRLYLAALSIDLRE